MRALRARLKITGLVVAAALLLGLVGTLPAEAAGKATVTETLNVRSGPGTSHKIIGTLKTGQAVTTRGTTAGWTKINFRTRTAYVATKYLSTATAAPVVGTSKINSGTVRASSTDLNLRAGAGTTYAVRRVLASGTRVTMTGRTKGTFAEVIAGRTTGWASTRYLKAASGLPAVVSTRVATAALDLRTSSGAGSTTVGEVEKGTNLSITGAVANARAQVVYRSTVRWVTARYLALPASTKPTVPGLPPITGTRYATTTLDIRSSSADRYEAVSEVPRGTKLKITGVIRQARMQIIFDGAARWVTARYLATKKPATAAGGSAYAVEKGLKPNAIKVHRAALKAFPEIVTYYGVRKDPIPDHPSGRALDLMLPGSYRSASSQALGYRVRDWARAHARELGIQYVIFHQHIWNIQRDGEGWRLMGSRGSDTANHINHIHITVYG
ncbi:SH3 domain-containing protein [uncultured Friedmanniella sp.]|uniref:SH3 domain-containing protein n=1 Tax=uncultured Friedmanniella sp. TaxID=335381 RepID=UPI0035CC81F4